MRFKNGPQLPGAGRTRSKHHHGSHTPTSPGTISLGKMAYHTKQICRQCTKLVGNLVYPAFLQNECYSCGKTFDPQNFADAL